MTIPNQYQHRELRSSSNPANTHTILNQILWSSYYEPGECCKIFSDINSQIAEEVICALKKGDLEARNYRITYNARLKELKVVLLSARIHDAHQPWLAWELVRMAAAGFLTEDEFIGPNGFNIAVGTAFKAFGGPYIGSWKEPDYCLYSRSLDLPTIVVESGWSESRPELERDMRLWLEGGQGAVQLVLLIKWTKNVNEQVSGDIRVFDLNAAGNIEQLQTEQVFPRPANAADQGINITRSQLYGAAPIPAGRNAADIWRFSLDRLRNVAGVEIQKAGYTPA